MSTREELAMVAARLETLGQGQRATYARDANLHVCAREDAYDAIWHAVIAAEDVWLAAEEALAAYDNENT